VFPLLFGAAALLYWCLTLGFEYADDEVLIERVHVLSRLLHQGSAQHDELKLEVDSAEEDVVHPRLYVRLVDQKQNSILETPRMSELLPIQLFPAAFAAGAEWRSHRVIGPSGRAFRAVAAEVRETRTDHPWLIQAGFDLREEEHVLAQYRYLLAAVLGTIAIVSILLDFRITRAALRPLSDIVETTRRVRISSLSERVPMDGLPADLAVLAGNFNAMLERLDQSFSRLSRFSADIAHELRTPLNTLSGETELTLYKARPAETYRKVLASNLEEYHRMAKILDALLFISRAETAETAIHLEAIDVNAEIRDIVEFYEPIAAGKCITFGYTLHEELLMQADRELFRRTVANVVSNAVAYTEPEGHISISAEQRKSAVRVEIADTGVGIPPEHLPRVFDRFFRVKPERDRASDHTGLGLSIVKTAMDLHDGSVEITSKPGRGTRVILTFPQAAKS
jgi:two-component system heavy metal sensor histidine kinase CusS